MTKPTQEQIKVFWEWCGLHREGHFWYSQSGKQLSEEMPPTDLNNLLEYAVPSENALSFHLSYEYYLSGYTYIAKVCAKSGIWRTAYHKTDPTIALFWALDMVRGSNETGVGH